MLRVQANGVLSEKTDQIGNEWKEEVLGEAAQTASTQEEEKTVIIRSRPHHSGSPNTSLSHRLVPGVCHCKIADRSLSGLAAG